MELKMPTTPPPLETMQQTINGLLDKITSDAPAHSKMVWGQAIGVTIEQIEMHYGKDAKLF